MNVIIKGMKMPKNCDSCDLIQFDDEELEAHCPLSPYYMWCGTPPDYIPEGYPLVELPTPHGRLIDADRLMEVIEKTAICLKAIIIRLKMACSLQESNKRLTKPRQSSKRRNKMDSFMKWQVANWKDDDFFPPELEPQRAVHMLVDYLLGDDWYFVNPVNAKQGNVYILHAILMRYSRKYRREVKKYRKHISPKRR